jgi:rubrerythrin
VSHELSSRHRNTLEKLLDHQGHANVEWREVISLLEQVADVEEEHNGKFKVKLGSEVLFLHRPKHKDVDQQILVDVRHLLEQGGVGLA